MTTNTLNGMVIMNVTECSEHAKGRIGRIVENINLMDDGTAFVMYPAGIRGTQPYFKLHGVTIRKRFPFAKQVVLQSDTGVYIMRPATAKEMNTARLEMRTRTAYEAAKKAFGDDICYAAPEQVMGVAEALLRKY